MNYIINFNPYINNNIDIEYLSTIETKILNNESITNKELIYFLNTIIYLTRLKLNNNLDNFDNKCDLAQSILYYYFKNLNCNIHPSMTQNVITNNIIGHSFLTLELNVDNKLKYYLLDPTYIQFFKTDKCRTENYYISPNYPDYILLTPNPGFFIHQNMKEQAKKLLDNGYIELTEEIAKMYGDSFYNTKTGTNPKNLTFMSIPGEIYINSFLKGKEPLSKTEEELINLNLNIPLAKHQTTNKKR